MRKEIVIQAVLVVLMAAVASLLMWLLVTGQVDFQSAWGGSAVVVAFFLTIFTGAGTLETIEQLWRLRRENSPPTPKEKKKMKFGRQ